MTQDIHQQRADYGVDAPTVVRNNALIGSAAAVVGTALYLGFRSTRPQLASISLSIGLWFGFWFLVTAAIMLRGSRVEKLHLRDQLLDSIPWRGDEIVLDVGCGRGLLLIGVAKRLTTGRVIGVDIWQSEDQSGDSPEATWANARAEGVASRIEIKNADARKLPFADNTFDVVVSSWVLHNIYNKVEREKAEHEIVRVLKPGGRVAIADIQHTAEYAEVFRQSGLTDVARSGPNFTFFIPTHVLMARKS